MCLIVGSVVCLADGLPKLAVRRLLQPVMFEPHRRLIRTEDKYPELLADLALHCLDVVLADRAAPANPNLKVYSHALGSSALAWYAPQELLAQAKKKFPHSLAEVRPPLRIRGKPPQDSLNRSKPFNLLNLFLKLWQALISDH